MITPMNKYSFLVFHSDYHHFVTELGKMGVLHISEIEKDENWGSVEKLNSQLKEIQDIQEKLLELGDTRELRHEAISAEEIVQEYNKIQKRLEELDQSTDEIEKEIGRRRPWGNFDYQDLEWFGKVGYNIRFYSKQLHSFDPKWEEMYTIFEIQRNREMIYFVVIAPSHIEVEIDAELHDPISKTIAELQEELEGMEKEQSELNSTLTFLRRGAGEILDERIRRIESELALQSVYSNTTKESGDSLHIFEGWAPRDLDAEICNLAEVNESICISTPSEHGEYTPIQLNNNFFSRLFEPITRLFDLPNYTELDLTPFFAPFFVLFFGFCLGDAGYGIVLILVGLFVKWKIGKRKKNLRSMLTLAQYFGVATILFGLLSGTFFGMNLIDSGYTLTSESLEMLGEKGLSKSTYTQLLSLEGEYFKSRSDFTAAIEELLGANPDLSMKVFIKNAEAGLPFVRSIRHLMQEPLNMFYLALIIGALQIIFGIFVRILNTSRRKGFKYAFSPIGWLILIITLILNAQGLFESPALNYLFYGLLAIAGIFILILNKPGKGILARFGGGLWDSYGMITGLFGDLLSYIRLFALGISSAILGFVFNDISLQLFEIPWIGWLLALVILLAGHSINILLAILGGVIHPMRLTFVEFYKNAGFEGGGKEYKPFSINN